jgi:hypothetical protein
MQKTEPQDSVPTPQPRRRLRHWLVGVPLTILILVALLTGALILFLDSAVKLAVEGIGPKLTQTTITVAKVHLMPFRGRGEINGLVVGNPAGFKTAHAIRMDKLSFRFQPRSLFTDRIVVDEILIVGPEITYELGLTGSNMGKILDNVEAATGGEGTPKPAPTPAKGEKKVQINHLLITNAHVRLSAKLAMGGAAPIPLPTIDMKDIGKEKEGKTFGQTVAAVFRAIGHGTVQAVTGVGKLIGKGAVAAGEGVVHGVEAVGKGTAKGVGHVVGGVKSLFTGREAEGTNAAAGTTNAPAQ